MKNMKNMKGMKSMTNEPEAEVETIEVAQDGRSATGRALHLFGAGALGGVLTLFGLALVEPLTHPHCHGASVSQREQALETRRRCIELGVTPDELASLDAAASPLGGE